MTRHVPVRDIAHLRLCMPADDRWVDDFNWIPVSASEFHLACRYYPLAISFEQQTPRLGLLVRQHYLTNPVLDESGRWRSSYRPIALRCYPFQAPHLGDDPLSDILIDADSKCLSPATGIAIVDEGGQPGRLLVELHRLFGLLTRTQESFAEVLDQFLISDLLVPLAHEANADDQTPLYVIDPSRFAQMKATALGAMARNRFLGVDLAVACIFSLRNLRADYRPKQDSRSDRQPFASASATPDTMMIDDLSLILDDGELVSLSDIDVDVAPPVARPEPAPQSTEV